MKKTYFALFATAALAFSLASCNSSAENTVLNDERDSLSWAIGMSLAQTAQSNFYNFDKEVVLKAFESYLAGEKQPISTDEYNAACQYISYLATTVSHQQTEQKVADNTKRQEEAFAKLVADNPNLKKAPEGFYYEVLREGKGPKAVYGKRLEFDFKGTNMFTGELIEQTYGKRGSVIHVLGNPMFEGLIEGMQYMRAGSKYRFYFPHEKVTGAKGVPPLTPVIYEIELHTIFED